MGVTLLLFCLALLPAEAAVTQKENPDEDQDVQKRFEESGVPVTDVLRDNKNLRSEITRLSEKNKRYEEQIDEL